MCDESTEQPEESATGTPGQPSDTPPDTAADTAVDWARPDTWPREVGGSRGPEPTRYGDWESNGRCTDF